MVARLVLLVMLIALALENGEANMPLLKPRLMGRREGWDYGPAMRAVAAKFHGTEGVVLHLGDSITYASPYTAWAREGEGKTPEDEAVLRWSHCGERNDRDGWYLASFDVDVERGRSFTAAGGVRADQYLKGGFKGLPSLDDLIREYNPQIAIVMLGSNDAWQKRPVADYAKDMEAIVTRLLANGTIPIVSTVPPTYYDLKTALAYNEAIWKLAEEHRLPVIDYYGEILARRPGTTWNGTLLARDDVHPTAERAGVTPTSEPTAANLRESGYLLRGWVSVKKLEEVNRRVFDR